MIVSFFEEFPDKKNLSKVKLINFPTKLYIAAKSLKDFEEIKRGIKNKYIKEVVYWPVLEIKEGYWLSPFTKRKALKRIGKELNGKEIPVLWDAELPRKRDLMFSQIPLFFQNKILINSFFKNYKGKIYVAEYFGNNELFKFFKLNFKPEKNVFIIKMFYTSMNSFLGGLLEGYLKRYSRKYGNKLIIGLGTIAVGILGDEPILSPRELGKDLVGCKKNKIKEVIIFRLGGLNKNYVKEINRVIS